MLLREDQDEKNHTNEEWSLVPEQRFLQLIASQNVKRESQTSSGTKTSGGQRRMKSLATLEKNDQPKMGETDTHKIPFGWTMDFFRMTAFKKNENRLFFIVWS